MMEIELERIRKMDQTKSILALAANTKQSEHFLITKIADRAVDLGCGDRVNIAMDLTATNQINPLDLNKLLNADDFNFLHDIRGINQNLDRDEIELKNCFLPRFTK